MIATSCVASLKFVAESFDLVEDHRAEESITEL
jgi:hypothetical protein